MATTFPQITRKQARAVKNAADQLTSSKVITSKTRNTIAPRMLSNTEVKPVKKKPETLEDFHVRIESYQADIYNKKLAPSEAHAIAELGFMQVARMTEERLHRNSGFSKRSRRPRK